MNRQEHLDWSKSRALQYVEQDDLNQAFASLISDLRKHPELINHMGIDLGTMLLISGNLSTKLQMKEFIEGFN